MVMVFEYDSGEHAQINNSPSSFVINLGITRTSSGPPYRVVTLTHTRPYRTPDRREAEQPQPCAIPAESAVPRSRIAHPPHQPFDAASPKLATGKRYPRSTQRRRTCTRSHFFLSCLLHQLTHTRGWSHTGTYAYRSRVLTPSHEVASATKCQYLARASVSAPHSPAMRQASRRDPAAASPPRIAPCDSGSRHACQFEKLDGRLSVGTRVGNCCGAKSG